MRCRVPPSQCPLVPCPLFPRPFPPVAWTPSIRTPAEVHMRTGFLLFALLPALSMAQAPAAPKSFVIADVHISPFTSNPFMHGNSIQGDRYFLSQATMVDLIATAYGVDGANVQ